MTASQGDASTVGTVQDFGGAVATATAVEGRSLRQIAWRRLRKDKVAMAGGVVALLLILVAVFAPVIVHFFGYDPNQPFDGLVDPSLGTPYGRFGGISSAHLLGMEPNSSLQRDVFSRVVYGAQISLLIAALATAVSVMLGLVLGLLAGFYGGWVGAVLTESSFDLHGIGKVAIDGIGNNDLPVVFAVVLFAATFIILANLVVDLLYGVIDPRVRRE
ncbi:ABC transporter permease subunit [Catenulispora subtropica]|uniref:Binding-protein-dependent transport systems inner membrane component n=1 Tax=Catenulispora subtropica TaxID=450798 RepID=A0ABP5BYC0_9ACTN